MGWVLLCGAAIRPKKRAPVRGLMDLALTKCGTLPSYISGKVCKWIACFQSTVYLIRQMTRVKKYLIIL